MSIVQTSYNMCLETKFQPFGLRNDKDIDCTAPKTMSCPENDVHDCTLLLPLNQGVCSQYHFELLSTYSIFTEIPRGCKSLKHIWTARELYTAIKAEQKEVVWPSIERNAGLTINCPKLVSEETDLRCEVCRSPPPLAFICVCSQGPSRYDVTLSSIG